MFSCWLKCFVFDVLQDLNKGARQVEICVGSDVVFNGELDKGCGNQVFDYGKTIQCKRTEQTETPSRKKRDHTSKKVPKRESKRLPTQEMEHVHQVADMMDNVSLHSDCDSPRSSVNLHQHRTSRVRSQFLTPYSHLRQFWSPRNRATISYPDRIFISLQNLKCNWPLEDKQEKQTSMRFRLCIHIWDFAEKKDCCKCE